MDLKKAAERIAKSVGEGNLVRAVLFGSAARGDYSQESDVDVLVVTRGKLSAAERERFREEWLNALLEGVVVEVLFLDVGEYWALRNAGSPLLKRVETEGIVLHDGA